MPERVGRSRIVSIKRDTLLLSVQTYTDVIKLDWRSHRMDVQRLRIHCPSTERVKTFPNCAVSHVVRGQFLEIAPVRRLIIVLCSEHLPQ